MTNTVPKVRMRQAQGLRSTHPSHSSFGTLRLMAATACQSDQTRQKKTDVLNFGLIKSSRLFDLPIRCIHHLQTPCRLDSIPPAFIVTPAGVAELVTIILIAKLGRCQNPRSTANCTQNSKDQRAMAKG